MSPLEILSRVNFGDIDGYGDPNLENYFLDSNYWQSVIESNTFFVVGKKGTGKSSIYRMIYEQGIKKGYVIDNRDFGDFPFEKLLQLDDTNFPKPNQYQSIWKGLILNIFARLIIDTYRSEDDDNIYFNQLHNYVNSFLGDVVDMHKELLTRTSKTNAGLKLHILSARHEVGESVAYGDGANNLTTINAELERLIINYLISSPYKHIYIQFDRLDDNYNQYQDVDQYYQAIISLFKVTYYLNQKFRSKNIFNAKTILYLRSDILKELGKRDAESARWEDFCLKINWAIINRSDWSNPKLLQMINKRIQVALNDTTLSFKSIFNNYNINLTTHSGHQYDVFKYIVERTMHRPRDLIQFCKCIQKEARETGRLYYRTIKDAEKEYGYWLVNSELANEINPILKNTENLFELLKLLGSKPFSLTDFNERYKSVSNIGMSANDLVYYLYDVGIFQNIDETNYLTRYRSSFRNEGRLDRNMKIIIHPAVWVGINA